MNNKKNKPKIKITIDNILSIASIIISLFVFIYSTTQIRKQDQKFDLELLDYQATQETKIQFEIADYIENTNIENQFTSLGIEVDYFLPLMWSCYPYVFVCNTGKINAKNVSIVIELESINKDWSPYISDASEFHIVPVDNIPYASDTKFKEYYSQRDIEKENQIILSIDYLTPDSCKVFYVVPNSDNYSSIGENSTTFNIKLANTEKPMGTIQKYLHEYFAIAYFSINAFCENCNQTDNELEDTYYPISNLDGCYFVSDNVEQINQNEELHQLRVDYYYLIPDEGFQYIPEIPSSVELK